MPDHPVIPHPQDTGNIGCGCDNSTVAVYQPKESPSVSVALATLKSQYGLDAKPSVDAAFYFDFALRGILAAKLVLDTLYYGNQNQHHMVLNFDDTIGQIINI